MYFGGLVQPSAAAIAVATASWASLQIIPTRAAARNPAPNKRRLSAVFFCHQ